MALDLIRAEVFHWLMVVGCKYVIIFGADMSSSEHVHNRKQDTLVLGKGTTQGLEDIGLAAERKYPINFSEQQKTFCLSLHYNGENSYLIVNSLEINKFKAKDSEINAFPLCLGNVSKDFSADDMKKTGLYGYVYDFQLIMIVLLLI